MAAPTYTPLPTAPARTMTPTTFATTADTFVAALALFQTEGDVLGAYAQTQAAVAVASNLADSYPTVASLLADTLMEYTPNGAVPVSVGDIVAAGGFRYIVVASGGDVQNSAGTPVQLEALPLPNGGFIGAQFGAIGDGVTDDRAALQLMIDRVVATGRGEFSPGVGIFALGKSGAGKWALAIVGDNVSVRGNGIGVTVLKLLDSTAIDTPVLRIEGSNISVSDIEIDGNKARISGEALRGQGEDEGIDLKGGTSNSIALINNCYIHDCGQDGIDVDTPYTKVIITNTVIEDCGGCGIHGDATMILVDNCQISGCGEYRVFAGGVFATEMAAIGSFFKDLHIRNTIMRDNDRAVIMRNTAEAGYHPSASLIGCSIHAESPAETEGVHLDILNSVSIRIIGNYIYGYDVGIEVVRPNSNSGYLISDNDIRTPSGGTCISVIGAGSHGDISIINNPYLLAPAGVAILLTDINRFRVSGNFIGSVNFGIRLDDVTNGTISDNWVSSAASNAIRFDALCTDIEIIGNNLPSSGNAGVHYGAIAHTGMRLIDNVCEGGVNGHASLVGFVARGNLGFLTETGGSEVLDGNGSSTNFNITHGLVSAPTQVSVVAGSSDAADKNWVSSLGAIDIANTFAVAPASGTGNVVFRWTAACYE